MFVYFHISKSISTLGNFWYKPQWPSHQQYTPIVWKEVCQKLVSSRYYIFKVYFKKLIILQICTLQIVTMLCLLFFNNLLRLKIFPSGKRFWAFFALSIDYNEKNISITIHKFIIHSFIHYETKKYIINQHQSNTKHTLYNIQYTLYTIHSITHRWEYTKKEKNIIDKHQ